MPERQKGSKNQRIRELSDGRDERRLVVSVRLGMQLAVRAAGTAGLGASPQSLVNDGLDGARAAATLGTAAETAIDLLGIAREIVRAIDRTADIVVGQDVAGTNNHGNGGLIGDAMPHRY